MIGSSISAWLASIPLMNQMMNMSLMTGMLGSGIALPILSMADLFASPNIATISFFVFVWDVGMIAMMFPAMIPVIAFYMAILTKSEPSRRRALTLGTPIFLGGYLLLYAALGVAAYTAIYLGFYLASLAPTLSLYATPAAAAILFGTGIWQLTPFKDKCLAHCISPMGFFLVHARRGLRGAFKMGSAHGYYCIGCCGMYMLVMLGVAAMSIPSMLILTSLIAVERVLGGAKWFSIRWFRFVSAVIFIALGGVLISTEYVIFI